jgi:transcriptional regulator with PAS, ATPase and Fis domain
MDPGVRTFLLRREYPGNVRELRQLMSRLLYRYPGAGPITVGQIPENDRPPVETSHTDWCDATFEQCIRRALAFGARLKEIGRKAENTAVRLAINEANGNLQQAASQLGVTDRALQLRRAAGLEPKPLRDLDRTG